MFRSTPLFTLLQLFKLILFFFFILRAGGSPLPPEPLPYPPLSGGKFFPGGSSLNPDPLRNYRWNLSAASNTSLQLITVVPTAALAFPASAFDNIGSLVNSSAGKARSLAATGTLRVDFGQVKNPLGRRPKSFKFVRIGLIKGMGSRIDSRPDTESAFR